MAGGKDIYPRNCYRPESPEFPFDKLFGNPPGDPPNTVSALRCSIISGLGAVPVFDLQRPFGEQAGTHEDFVGARVEATRLTVEDFLSGTEEIDPTSDFIAAVGAGLKIKAIRGDVKVTPINGTPVLISLEYAGEKSLRVFNGASVVRVKLGTDSVQICGWFGRRGCDLIEGGSVVVEGIQFSLNRGVFRIQRV